MIKNKKVVIVFPAYNAEKTLEQTYNELPHDIIDEIVIVDDCSQDNTVEIAKRLGIKHIIRHEKNKGYGANQKTCYDKSLELMGDIIIMVHPDYQYTPLLIEPMAYIIANGLYPVVFGSRILGRGALKGGMPLYKYISNRILTFFENIMLGQKLTEYHTGYRAYSREVLKTINYHANSDDFIFDNQIIAQIFYAGFSIAEISCPTKYFPEASSISFKRSVNYGLGVITTSFQYRFQKWKLARYEYLEPITK
ncbi:MAG: glycosyltransferase family 2 protein [Bacteroidales bacterium]|jgi:glycosyltransferase involved in cell wall biosynthesis|nr:glycosyltransferase family 2 protein [Bacteroidales bacterium]MDI9575874.1 glycosyltransferase family 2 protein [Bacteroidota bacterium]MDD2594176.1 glycosyltransferase family 2 protein [Bacteroidales bacterium]MDD3756088.1 glycosyltransferase family 2 protein [Bacteroidales bacterium]MDY0401486.1 glycosyltransferase family 2 protein [Bacteroidales bacterium]